MLYRVTFSLLGAVGLASSASQSTAVGSVVTPEIGATGPIQTVIADTLSTVPEITASTDSASTVESPESTAERIMQEIEDMADQAKREQQEQQEQAQGSIEDEETNVDDISPEERARQDAMPRNPKKRMWEENVEGGDAKRDEL